MFRPLLCATVLLLCVSAFATPLTLAREGKPTATIVIPDKADAKIRAAALDLQHYVKAICGVELPLATDGKRVQGTGIYVGVCEPTSEGDLPDRTLNPETYAIRVRDGNLYLTGRQPSPVSFAVSSFLEDNLGVRWFAPGSLWEYVPQGKPGELVVEVKDLVSVPGTSPRVWSGHGWTEEWRTWDQRNKAVLSEIVPRRQFQNNLHRVFPPAKYATTHPEYYPLINGKRWIPAPDDRYWRPCESNPDVLRLTVEYARKWFDDNPTIDSFSLGMDDVSHLCSCPNCRAMDPRPDSYEKKEFSDRHYKFVNAVAREVAKTHPDRYIGTLIYAIARKPPETVDRLEDNVFGFITQTCGMWYLDGRQAEDEAVTREWARRCKHLSRYDYIGFGTMTPRVFPHMLDRAIKFDKSLGFEGMYTEVYDFLPNTAPMIWALAKLEWDHTLNLDDLLQEFYTKMYGSAAPLMKQYFDLLERSYYTDRPGHGAWEHRKLSVQAAALSVEDLDEAFRLLQQATNATGDPDAQERIFQSRMGLQYGSFVIRAADLSKQALATAVTDEKSAQSALQLAEKISQLSVEREKFWADMLKMDGLAGDSIRGLTGQGYLVGGQAPSLESGGTVAALKVLAWYSENAPERSAQIAERISSLGGPVSEAVKSWVWAQQTKPQNLSPNGNFEDVGTNTQPAEKDWTTEGAPKGWSTWSSLGDARFELLGGKGHQGSIGASIASSKASACYLQTVPVKESERYLCVAWMKGDPAGAGQSIGKLSVRFRDAKGSWHARRDLEPSVDMVQGQADWQPVMMTVTIPEGVAGAVIMLGTSDQAEGSRILFDDVAFYKLP